MKIPNEYQINQNPKTKRNVWLLIFFGMMLSILFIGAMRMKQAHVSLLTQVELKDQLFSKMKNANGQTIAIQEQRILQMTKENMRLVETVNKYKKLSGQVRIETVTEIKEVKIPYEVLVVSYRDKDSNLFIKVPLPFSKKDSFYTIIGKVQQDGVTLSSISIPNALTITTGLTNGGFFKKDKYVIEVISDNPHTEFTKIKNTQFVPKTKFYKKWWFGFSVGAVTSIFVLK